MQTNYVPTQYALLIPC